MKQESGRSLIEIIGVLAIGVIMIVAAYSIYKTIDTRQKRLIAFDKLEEVVKKTKILYEYSGYADASIENLVAKGAISDARPPFGTEWYLRPTTSFGKFYIVLKNVPNGDCKYLKIRLQNADWVSRSAGTCQNVFMSVK